MFNTIDQIVSVMLPLYLVIGLSITYNSMKKDGEKIDELIEDHMYFFPKSVLNMVMFLTWFICVLFWPFGFFMKDYD